jgi:hypothetical protein
MACGQPVRGDDQETHTVYVLIKEDLYRSLSDAVAENDFTLHEFEGLIPFE